MSHEELLAACKNLPAYEVEQEEFIPEINSQGILLRHKRCGARIALLANDDENKVFSIAFRTTPKDSKGTPHIIEHSVLCGSKNFPLKDPFVELAKGSLNTFLNALTYADKTMYPVASCNEQDFKNLMHIYMDAVFYPNIYQHKEIFYQEGWHYELENLDDALQYNGVVYNEMKGVFSSPNEQLARSVQESLFPDTVYGVESGGEPEHIVELSYEEFLDFHRNYYHPCNSYIYLYGDMDMIERLCWLDEEYLSTFTRIHLDSSIGVQAAFEKPVQIEKLYEISEEEAGEDRNTYYSYNVVVEDSDNTELYTALQVLEYVLVDAPGAILRQALLDEGLGNDIMSYYENGIRQPYFSIIAKGAPAGQEQRFEECIRKTLAKLVKEGLDKKTIQAAINGMEFRAREADFGSNPKGLVYGMQMLDSWLYDDTKAFVHLYYEDMFAFLKEKVQTDYFEGLIQHYFLDNTHRSLVILKPQMGLEEELAKQMEEKLQHYMQSLSVAEREQLVADTKALKQYQETPNTEAELATIPLLKREDIRRKIRPLYNEVHMEAGVKVLHHNVFTNGICYMTLNYDITDYKQYIPYISLLATLLGYIDTKNYSYLDFNNEMYLHTGGISTDTKYYLQYKKPKEYRLFFEVAAKALPDELPKTFALIEEMLFSTSLEDEKRLKEVITESRSRLQMRLRSSGHMAAAMRASSTLSETGYLSECIGGIEYYHFLEQLDDHFEEEKDKLKHVLSYLLTILFDKDALVVSCTADKEIYEKFTASLQEFIKNQQGQTHTGRELDKANATFAIDFGKARKKKEAFQTTSKVQYVAIAGDFMEKGYSYTGVMSVLKTILSYEYLWKNVRVLGGAYGVMCNFGVDGTTYLVSYRDPQLQKTLEIYEGIPDYINTLDLDERELTKYIIGTMSNLDMPLSPAAMGRRSFRNYMMQCTEEELQKNRDAILDINLDDLKKMADVMKAVLGQECCCVIGNDRLIAENADLFEAVETMK